MEGKSLAAGELAQVAGVKASTISEHLTALVDGGLVAAIAAGRHRYYHLAGPEVAAALEAFSRICPATPVRTLRQSVADENMRRARLCYDHLAGALGVALFDQMSLAGWIVGPTADRDREDFDVTESGAISLAKLGVDVDGCRNARRHFARSCLDWSERRAHLAGALGAALAAALLNEGWLRADSTTRAMQITPEGDYGLQRVFQINLAR
jgi:hypothetical protein